MDNGCNVPGCRGVRRAKGMCDRHYARVRRNGHARLTAGNGCRDVKERLGFRGKRAPSGCLEWQGSTNKQGYAKTRINDVHYAVHRLAWELYNGPIPEGLCVCHRCDNPRCFEVAHLFLGTHKDNVADAIAKGRHMTVNGKNGRLTKDQILGIYKSIGTGALAAKQFGVCEATVYNIRNGKTWAQVTRELE
jgi:HNH endonuclease